MSGGRRGGLPGADSAFSRKIVKLSGKRELGWGTRIESRPRQGFGKWVGKLNIADQAELEARLSGPSAFSFLENRARVVPEGADGRRRESASDRTLGVSG